MKLAGKSILVVEDEFLIASLLEDMLDELGCTKIVTAKNLSTAFDALNNHAFDAVVLDVNLDGVNSEPFADELQLKSIPFIFSTGYTSNSLADRWSAIPCVQKPFKGSELEDGLASVLR